MLVSDWAGPSCIARAISRRRSSWAPSTMREIEGESACASPDSDRVARSTGSGRNADGVHLVRDGRDGRAMAQQRLALSLQQVHLRFHEDCPPGEGNELLVGLRQLLRVRALVGLAELLCGLGTFLLVARRLDLAPAR